MTPGRSSAARVAHMGMLFALALVLSLLEGAAPLPLPVPGARIGLSNIVVMYCLFLRGAGSAYLLGVLKAMFVLMTRQASGALLSLSGGILSITAMLLIMRFYKGGFTAVSVGGAVAHNLGQLFCASLYLGEKNILLFYLPPLAAVGVLVGLLTAVLFRAVLPAINRIPAGGREGS
ncbi:MAG: Gx transporter family protein [Oscillospiraceae bacterium]|jgi:heptaprenyl diphosphate synthase|nr:Gx transporter family protein [Oscillospiraceae bacterium]